MINYFSSSVDIHLVSSAVKMPGERGAHETFIYERRGKDFSTVRNVLPFFLMKVLF